MNLCKPPEPLRLTGNNDKNWREFKEQLQWFLEGTESTEKSDGAKIGIMLSHAGKEARELYKTLAADGETRNSIKSCRPLSSFVHRKRISCMKDRDFGNYVSKKVNPLMHT